MLHELKIPEVGESIREVQISQWLKSQGQWVEKDENLVEIESEKATVAVAAPVSGVLAAIGKPDGATAAVGEVIGTIDDAAPRPAAGTAAAAAQGVPESPAPAPQPAEGQSARVMPAAERLLAAHGMRSEEVQATGPGGRLLKEDVLRRVEPPQTAPGASTQSAAAADAAPARPSASADGESRREEVVPMSLIRRRIAERLVEAQQTAALLTTFNEVDLSTVVQLRQRHRDDFQKKHGVKLGFMSFFVKAVVEALRQYPAINAEIRGEQVVYRSYYDIGIAVGGGKGLVVPVLRDAQRMGFADIERAIADFAARAQANQLKPDELTGGTFTISNGGIYGSLLSTPIVNPPQSGILGLHAIQDRPVARDQQVVIRPMMYIALTYDHRIVDGREAVSFLRSVKEAVEEPARMLLDV